MRRKLFLSSTILFVLLSLGLVVSVEASSSTWTQTYGGTGGEAAYSVVTTADGGYAIAGTKNGDFWLVKTDDSGNMEWNQTYGGTNYELASALVETSDGGYAIAGVKSGDFWLIKTDEYGIVAELCPPYICVVSPQNKTYSTDNVSLNFTVNEPVSWMGYSLDGQDNVTVTENTLNLTGLVNGLHNITVYATDTSGNTGASETFIFTVAKEPDPTQVAWTTIALVAAIAAVASIATIRHYLKNKKQSY
jgi:hypothetical protein